MEEVWRSVLGNCRSFVWKDVRKGCIVLRDINQGWWTEEVAKAVGEKEAWKRRENIKIGGGSGMQGCCTCLGRRKQQGELLIR